MLYIFKKLFASSTFRAQITPSYLLATYQTRFRSSASRRHHGVLYTHNDRSSPHPNVFALNASTSGLTKFLQMPLN